jgi:predicted ATPase/DNA-binding CsgD family transcriptional regulator
MARIDPLVRPAYAPGQVTRSLASPHVKGLPRELTSFVGRRRELREVKEALSSTPLLTLIGPAGVGKTRLALRAAADLGRAFPDGVWVAELADLRDPALLAETVASALGHRDESTRWLVGTLIDFLTTKQLLLILDNCEHLLDACAVLADSLLRACPHLKILSTSREALGIGGETVLEVQPLPLPEEDRVPPPEALLKYDAVRLFVERAQYAWPQFEPSSSNARELCTLCRRLDGLPLALELAAVRIRAFTVSQILEQMDRRFGLLSTGSRTESVRHRSLRAAIDWSFELLSKEEQIVWRRLSIFAGGFDLEAANAICRDDGVREEAAGDLVASLVEKSILRRDVHGSTSRYRMLDSIRELGRARLRESGEEPRISERYRDWYADLAARVSDNSWGPSQAEWWDRAHLELANLREVLGLFVAEPGAAEAGLAMAADLAYYWLTRGTPREGRRWLDALLGASPGRTRECAKALGVDGWLALVQGDVSKGLELLDECEVLAAELGEDANLSVVSFALRGAVIWRGDLGRAEELLERSLQLEKGAPDRRNAAIALGTLQIVWSERGDHSKAFDLCRRSAKLCREAGDRYILAWMLAGQAYEAWHMHEWDRAEELEAESLRLRRDLDNKVGMAHSIEILAWNATSTGRAERAARLLGGLQSLWESIPATLYPPYVRYHDACLADARSSLGVREFDRLYRDGRGIGTEQLVAVALEEKQPVVQRAASRPSPAALTPREGEIAALVARGLSNKDIASKLVISQRTAETHVEHILTKLGFTSRAQIAAWVVEDEARMGLPAPNP